jgi:predicted kinase
MNILAVTIGSPGSGKSTWIEQNNLKAYCLSVDEIRLLIQSPVVDSCGKSRISQKNDKKVFNLLFGMLEERMERGELTVVDACHSKLSEFGKYKHLVEKYRYQFYGVDFRGVPIDKAKENNKNRPEYKFVPEEGIDLHYERFQNSSDLSKIGVKIIKPENFLNEINFKPENLDNYEEIVIIGDIHGCIDPVNEFFEKHPFSEKNYYLFLGDLVDRGLDNAGVVKWFTTVYNRSNVSCLISNHGKWMKHWSFDEPEKIRSQEFIFETQKQLEEAGVTKGVVKNMAKREKQIVYFSYHGKEFVATHGGIPHFGRGLAFYPSVDFMKGVGKYEDVLQVAETWVNSSDSNQFNIFGHRGMGHPMKLNERVYCLEGEVEFGGHLRALRITPDEIIQVEIKNNKFRPRKLIQPSANVKVFEDVKKLAESLRGNKDVREIKNRNISSFCFRKNVFYEKTYGNTKELKRGFFVNNISFEVVATGFEKFYNIGETEESSLPYLLDNFKSPLYLFEKYNGFLGLLGYESFLDDLIFASKSLTDGVYAERFERIFRTRYTPIYDNLKLHLKANNISLAFEVIDPIEDPHIIGYCSDHVVLIGAFERTLERQELSYQELCEIGSKFGIPVKKLLAQINISDLKEHIKHFEIEPRPEKHEATIEGVVIQDSNGKSVKLKSKYYQTWKFARSLKDRILSGKQINPSWISTPLLSEFYDFCKKQNPEVLKKSIIDLRDLFYRGKDGDNVLDSLSKIC